MDLVKNFFCALSECFCEIFPETLTCYKLLLMQTLEDQEIIEQKFKDYITTNKQNLISKNCSALPPINLGAQFPQITLQKIINHPQGQANADIIWDHIFVIIKFLAPETELSIAPAAVDATTCIENLITQVMSSIPPLDMNSSPHEIFKTIANSDALPDLFNKIQSEIQTHPELTPANLIMAAAQLLLQNQKSF